MSTCEDQPGRRRGPRRHSFVLAVTLLLIGAFFVWIPLSSAPTDDSGSYYTLLAEGLSRGHLHLPVKPNRDLLALPDPYDPATNAAFRLHDASLFQGRYYLYFGPLPAIFAIPEVVLGVDTDMRVVTALVALGAVITALGLVRRLASRASRQHLTLYCTVIPISLAFGSLFPIALRRVAVYEVAIVCGVGLALVSLFALSHALPLGKEHLPRSTSLALLIAGTSAGLAAWTRPPWIPLIAVSVVLLVIVSPGARVLARTLSLYLTPVMALALLASAYNFARFGSATEFGNTYQLAGVRSRDIRPSTAADVLEKLRVDLLVSPQVDDRFPFLFLSAPIGPPDLSSFFAEPSVGLFLIAPAIPLMLVVFAIALVRRRLMFNGSDVMVLLLPVTSLLVLALQGAALPATTFRYIVEVSPLMIVFAIVVALRLLSSRYPFRAFAGIALATTITVTVPAVTMVSMTGYYDTLRRGSPKTWTALEQATDPLSSLLDRASKH